MTEAENIRNVELQGVDMIGFIFTPNLPVVCARCPGICQPAPNASASLSAKVRKHRCIPTVSSLDYIQLHGNEAPGTAVPCAIGLHLIKAFSILLPRDLLSVSATMVCSDYLFDTKTLQYGGSGNQFDWNPPAPLQRSHPVPAQRWHQPHSAKPSESSAIPISQVSTSTAAETAPGIKDVERISNFLKELREVRFDDLLFYYLAAQYTP